MHNAIRGNDAIFSDLAPRPDKGTPPNPRICANQDRFDVKPLIPDAFTCDVDMLLIANGYVLANRDARSDLDQFAGHQNGIVVDRNHVAKLNSSIPTRA